MPDTVLRHLAYGISFNPNRMPWQVDIISPFSLVRQLGHTELLYNSAKAEW